MCNKIIVFAAFTITAVNLESVGAAKTDLSKIYETWRQREEVFSNVTGTWIAGVAPKETNDPVGAPLPAIAGESVEVWLSGISMRIDHHTRDFKETFDANTGRSTYGGQGVVRAVDTAAQLRKIEDMGFLWFFRPTALGAGSGWRLAPSNVNIDGHDCAVLIKKYGGGTVDRLYVDMNRRYIPMRFEHNAEGSLWGSVDIQYAQDESGVWLPSSWYWREQRATGSCSGAEFRILETIPKSRFRNIFPAGMHVVDARIAGASGGQTMIAHKDGSLHPIPPKRSAFFSISTLLVVVGAVVLGVIVGLPILKRRT